MTEEFPFDENVLVFKVMGKIFALTDVNEFESINLKCDPEEAVLLRERFDCVVPGYHMNKEHWNTIILNGSVTDKLIYKWIDHSYEQVVKGLPKKQQQELA